MEDIKNYLLFLLLYTLLITILVKVFYWLMKYPTRKRIDEKYKSDEEKRQEVIKERKEKRIVITVGFIIVNVMYVLIKFM